MKKKVNFKPKISSLEVDKKIDEWVLQKNSKNEIEEENSTPPTEYFRFTVVLPDWLHKRIKKTCAVSGISMKKKIITLLEKEFPET
jgi:hypothetical protein